MTAVSQQLPQFTTAAETAGGTVELWSINVNHGYWLIIG